MRTLFLLPINFSIALTILMTLVFQPSLLAQGNEGVSSDVKIRYDDWNDVRRNRSMPVKIYMSADYVAEKPMPVVVFSHGLGGSREAAIYLGQYWARHGYICFFIQHPGSDQSFWKGDAAAGVGRDGILAKFKTTVKNPMHAVNRAEDVHFAIDQIEQLNKSDSQLRGKLDLNEIAIAGHSYGSWTALTASGQRLQTPGGRSLSSPDERVKAAIYLSPTAPREGVDPAVTFGEIKIPGLHFTGTRDDSPVNDSKAYQRRIAFDNISKSDQYLLILDGADHMVFGGRPRQTENKIDATQQRIVQEMSLKFLDAYLKGDRQALGWLREQAPVDMKKFGTYEFKVAKSADPRSQAREKSNRIPRAIGTAYSAGN